MDDLARARAALLAEDFEQARELLRPVLQEQAESAEAWFLASQAAVNAAQKRHFLEKAVALDPLHAEAANRLYDLVQPTGERAKRASTTDEAIVYASFLERVLAFIIDQMIMAGAGGILVLLFSFSLPLNARADTTIAAIWGTLLIFALLLTFIVYQVFFLSQFDGQTLGKMLFNIRVIKRDMTPLSLWEAFLRSYIGYFLALTGGGLGFLWVLRHPERQGWHDLLLDTRVIKA